MKAHHFFYIEINYCDFDVNKDTQSVQLT